MSTALTPPTTKNVADFLTAGDGDYDDGGDWWPSLRAEGDVVEIGITPIDKDGNRLPKVRVRAVVVAAAPEITSEVARHVLFHLGCGGYPGSQFVQHLLRAFEMADLVNRAQLGAGFPAYHAAFELYRDSDTGVAELQEIAAKGFGPAADERLVDGPNGGA